MNSLDALRKKYEQRIEMNLRFEIPRIIFEENADLLETNTPGRETNRLSIKCIGTVPVEGSRIQMFSLRGARDNAYGLGATGWLANDTN